jgi:hypothetical protein
MADTIFFRANPNAPIREGDAVSTMPSALPGTGSIYAYTRPGMNAPPSGNAAFAQNTLSGRFMQPSYYDGARHGTRHAFGPVFVSGVPTLILPANSGRIEGMIINNSPYTIYLGGADVSSASGIPLLSNDNLDDITDNDVWYGIVPTGVADVRGWEIY